MPPMADDLPTPAAARPPAASDAGAQGGDAAEAAATISLSPPSATAAPPDRLHLHMPVDVRSASLAVLAVLAVLVAMRMAAPLLIPLLLGVAVSYALSPTIDRLERLHLPRAVAAALLLGAIGGGIGGTAFVLSDDAAALVESLPAAAQKVRRAVRAQRGGEESTIDKVQRAASEMEKAAEEGGARPAVTPRGVTRVTIEKGHFDIGDWLWSGTMGLATTLGQAGVVLFLAFFLLASGNSFRRKLVKIAGPTFARRRITVQVLDEINEQIHRHLRVQLTVSVIVGVATTLAFLAVGLEQAMVWGVAALVLNFIPYIGSLVLALGAAIVAFVQFGKVDMALLISGISLLIHLISGNLLTPWLSSRASRMNAVTVFVGVLFFGWLWGLWGLLLGVPVLAALKAVCDRVEELKPIGELMGQ